VRLLVEEEEADRQADSVCSDIECVCGVEPVLCGILSMPRSKATELPCHVHESHVSVKVCVTHMHTHTHTHTNTHTHT
jgi:hypothetical protein